MPEVNHPHPEGVRGTAEKEGKFELAEKAAAEKSAAEKLAPKKVPIADTPETEGQEPSK